MTGPLALLGGDPWSAGAGGITDVLAALLARSGGEVVLLPTAAAYERPGRVASFAATFFDRLGTTLSVCPLLGRKDAEDRELAATIAAAGLIYLADGSPLHLRSVLKDSTAFAALVAAWHGGAAVAGAGAGAMVLSDPMVDPRGGAFSVGLGLVRELAVVTGEHGGHSAQLERTLALAPAGCAVVALGQQDAIVRDPDGTWHAGRTEPATRTGRASETGEAGADDENRAPGAPAPPVFVDGEDEGIAALAGKPIG